jgi:hypothetical protein
MRLTQSWIAQQKTIGVGQGQQEDQTGLAFFLYNILLFITQVS